MWATSKGFAVRPYFAPAHEVIRLALQPNHTIAGGKTVHPGRDLSSSSLGLVNITVTDLYTSQSRFLKPR